MVGLFVAGTHLFSPEYQKDVLYGGLAAFIMGELDHIRLVLEYSAGIRDD